jgi:hypothetical protein
LHAGRQEQTIIIKTPKTEREPSSLPRPTPTTKEKKRKEKTHTHIRNVIK